ncbi:TIGR02453 family protein [Maritimibacter sp. DP1N21-5]|uniref:TIGR02453 family protein n=1 Tax=Maritimibacter sp. DP1N21-5 TaxID=2836867 RepID=UPI001C47B042|nr:TIGR02453 family protein [Maritimibacter sp. DP1N21-5]MBV7410304.1 TIGR02453 family protein [Maritimibacter sp. DP1N21-5]
MQDMLIPQARCFFADLAAQNTRDWFAAHKALYDTEVKAPAEALLERMTDWCDGVLGVTVRPKLYRIHRDIRFSGDKTPYNTHLHMQWSMTGAPVCLLFGASRDYCKVGIGAMTMDKDKLGQWRAAVARGDDVLAEVAALRAAGWTTDDPHLRRVPAPYAQDHPEAAHLRRKGIVLWHDMDEAEIADLDHALKARFTEADGWRRSLARVIG